jgi:SOS response regulatory protein OraA/RecX
VARVVTALREQPRGRVEVHLDGAAWRLVPTDAVVRTGLVVGRTLDRATARTLGRELRRADALDRAARALRPRDRSRQALDARLATAGIPAAARGDALDTLERVGLVDDARVATTRAQSLAGRGFGDAAIRHDLEGEGAAAELVEDALAGLEPEHERARRLVERRGAADLKTARWLAAKGFEAASIEAALGGLEELGAFAGDG